MKNKSLKKSICIFIFFVFCFACLNINKTVYAEESYKQYYLLAMITQYEKDNLLNNPFTGKAYFRALSNSNVTYSDVCIYRSDPTECGSASVKMSLDTFYDKYIAALAKEKTDSITNNGVVFDVYSTEDTSGDTSIKYFTHLKWEMADGTLDNGVPVTGQASKADLKNGSFLPKTEIHKVTGSSALVLAVTRTKIAGMTDGVQGFSYTWPNAETTQPAPTYMAPAAYYAEYQVCDGNPSLEKDELLYKATINYLYKDTKEVAATPFSREYYDGTGETVTSPKISGCTPDLSSVDILIQGKDFTKTVYYTCSVAKNPGTGNTLFIVCMTVGFSCLAFFIAYLFIGRKKVDSEI